MRKKDLKKDSLDSKKTKPIGFKNNIRPDFIIEDKNLEKLVKDIIYRIDVPYCDTDAYDISILINNYLKNGFLDN